MSDALKAIIALIVMLIPAVSFADTTCDHKSDLVSIKISERDAKEKEAVEAMRLFKSSIKDNVADYKSNYAIYASIKNHDFLDAIESTIQSLLEYKLSRCRHDTDGKADEFISYLREQARDVKTMVSFVDMVISKK